MDKLVAFFKNVWLRRGVALLCWGYTAMLVWFAWLNFAYHFEFENPTSLFVLYLSYPITWIITLSVHLICFAVVWKRKKGIWATVKPHPDLGKTEE